VRADIAKLGLLEHDVVGTKVAMEVTHNRIIVKPIRTSRWDVGAVFPRKGSRYGDDHWLVPDDVEDEHLYDWYEN